MKELTIIAKNVTMKKCATVGFNEFPIDVYVEIFTSFLFVFFCLHFIYGFIFLFVQDFGEAKLTGLDGRSMFFVVVVVCCFLNRILICTPGLNLQSLNLHFLWGIY
jgi:hypothetical protein